MQISKLYEIEIIECNSPIQYQTIDLLKQAITDWPTEVKTVEEFLFNVEKYLRCSEITTEVLNHAVSRIGTTSELWQTEALSSIVELVNINQGKTFESIIDRLLLDFQHG